MMSRLLKVKSHLAEVVDELGWDNTPNSQWKQLKNMVQLLKPFAQYTSLTSAEESTTISPVIMELKLHLEMMRETHGLSQVANTLLRELLRRFKFATDPTANNFDPLYVTATFLNPYFKDILETSQISPARAHIIQMIRTGNETESTHDATDANHIEENSEHHSDNATKNTEDGKEPRLKRFKHLHTFLAEKLRQSTPSDFTQSEEDIELNHYIQHQNVEDFKDDTDPFNFWLENVLLYPKISRVSLDLLATPASTAPIEHIFSIRGEATLGKRNRLTHKNLEREILLRHNKLYL